MSVPLPVIETFDLTPAATSALQAEIRARARERNAVILAHNYQRPEVQDIADFVGDSLGLSRQAAKADADVIVFCGVHFMAASRCARGKPSSQTTSSWGTSTRPPR